MTYASCPTFAPVKYLRTYPLFMQVLLFLLLTFTLLSFAYALTQYFIPVFSGHSVKDVLSADETSSPYLMRAKLFANAAIGAGLFLLPALLFAYLAHPRPMPYLGLRRPARPAQWIAVALITVGMIPLLSGLQDLVQMLPLSQSTRAAQASNTAFVSRLVQEAPPATLLALFVCIAGITALQEELFFRGVLMRLVHKGSGRRMVMAILIPALLFASQHANQPTAMVSIFIAAIALASVYALTGSLWLSIWMHLLFNGAELLMLRYTEPYRPGVVAESHTPWWFVLAGAAVFAAGWYWLYSMRTPLPANWSDDYAPGENGPQSERGSGLTAD